MFHSMAGRYWYIFTLLVVGILVLLTWGNYQFASSNPGGNDFLVHWVGTRALFIDGESPYSDRVSGQIQTLAYGRPARPGEHELRVAYPLYSVIFFLPVAFIEDYTLARAIWMTILEIGVVFLTLSTISLTRWRLGLWSIPLILVFAIFWYHGLRPIINGNAVIIVSFLITSSFLAIRAGRDELAGILLGLSTIKPHLVVVCLTFIAIWMISQRRWKFLFWLVITIGLLSAVFILFIPDWPVQNLREILRYSSYNPPGTPAAIFSTWLPATGERIGWVFSAFWGILMLFEWLLSLRKDFRRFLWTACLTLAVSPWLGIQTDPGNFIMMFVALGLIFANLEERWGRSGGILAILCLLVLFLVPWLLFLETMTVTDQPQQSPIMFFPLPFMLIIGLYWIRWWLIRPPRMSIEEIRLAE